MAPLVVHSQFSFFFFNDTATTEIYTLSLHDALPIYFSPSTSPAGQPGCAPGRTTGSPAAPRPRPGAAAPPATIAGRTARPPAAAARPAPLPRLPVSAPRVTARRHSPAAATAAPVRPRALAWPGRSFAG